VEVRLGWSPHSDADVDENIFNGWWKRSGFLTTKWLIGKEDARGGRQTYGDTKDADLIRKA
jgi:hypothetical protein